MKVLWSGPLSSLYNNLLQYRDVFRYTANYLTQYGCRQHTLADFLFLYLMMWFTVTYYSRGVSCYLQVQDFIGRDNLVQRCIAMIMAPINGGGGGVSGAGAFAATAAAKRENSFRC